MTDFTKVLALTCLAAVAMPVGASADTKAYGYLFGSKDGRHGFVSFDIAKPQTLTIEGSRDFGSYYPSAGEYVDGKIYTYRVSEADYFELEADSWAVYDAETFKLISSKDMYSMNRAVDMTYDYTTNTMYALIEDRRTSSTLIETSLYAIDLATGDYTLIGSPGELKAIDGNNKVAIDALITLACDPEGQLYAMSSYRYLYKIDKFTGKVEQAAPRHNLGTASQFQSMTFSSDGKLWWAQAHPSYGHFCEIDLTTGVPGGFVDFRTDYEKLNKLGDDAQLTALFFKDKNVRSDSPNAVTELSASISENDVNTVILSWVNPTEDYSGNDAEPTAIRVYRIGTTEPIATLSGDATSYTDTSAPNGNTTYEVIAENNSGCGFPAFTTIFAGYDRLKAVNDLVLTIDDRTANVTWSAPTATVNGGYSDFNAITYNVYRANGNTITSLETGIDKTEFTETVEDDGTFYYIIEPVSGGALGVQAETESFTLTSPKSIPYFTGFEDDQDGQQWIFINASTNTGWSIGKKSYIYDGSKTAIGSTLGNTADDWLISPPLEFEAGEYTVDFYANGASYDTHTFSVCLGNDPKDPKSFTKNFYSVNNEKVYDETGANASGSESKGWAHIETGFKVDDKGIYHVGFHNTNPTTYANLRIDNLSVKKSGQSGITAVGSNNKVTFTTCGKDITVTSSIAITNISVINIAGLAVESVDGESNTITVSCSDIASGVYVVTVRLEDGSLVYKKIVM